MSVESDVQLLHEGTGPKVRTLTITTLIDGVATDVEMQVVAVSDSDGHVWDDTSAWQEEVLAELRTISERLLLINERLE